MFCRCAGVSFTLLAVCDDACGSVPFFAEQPARDTAVASAMTAAARTEAKARRRAPRCLLVMVRFRQVRAVPPAAAKRQKQRRRVGVSIGLCLHQIDLGLL